MNVSLSHNGWHAKLYKWVTRREPNFANLCPYFWTTLFFIFASPFVALFRLIPLPSEDKLLDIIPVMSDKTEKKVEFLGKIVLGLMLTFAGGVLILALIHLFLHGKLLISLALIAGLVAVVALASLIGFVLIKLVEKFWYSDTADFLGGSFLMFWHKVCPAIDWTDVPPVAPVKQFDTWTLEDVPPVPLYAGLKDALQDHLKQELGIDEAKDQTKTDI